MRVYMVYYVRVAQVWTKNSTSLYQCCLNMVNIASKTPPFHVTLQTTNCVHCCTTHLYTDNATYTDWIKLLRQIHNHGSYACI